jgi:hypothetical protein
MYLFLSLPYCFAVPKGYHIRESKSVPVYVSFCLRVMNLYIYHCRIYVGSYIRHAASHVPIKIRNISFIFSPPCYFTHLIGVLVEQQSIAWQRLQLLCY